ncbi:transcription factor TGAL9-like isoform X2 [Panicum virgatum]|uniref:transcription factor TGAL9-like isoform X2 n=1 Tax=Panicum virgatum TaxID=38727 RepID=UPI0019D62E3F|nr:transcription factor TGAL9-like isoform X2 [Panicum virgatum]
MGDRPWQQQPHEQASYPHAGMVQAASSSAHGGIIKEGGGGYDDMAEFDQVLFLYLNSQDQTSAIQDQPQTLNIFPSQPMHVVEPALPKHQGSMGTNNTTPNAGAGPSSKRPPPAAGGPKDGKTAAVKREAGSSGGALGSGTPSTSKHQEGPRTPDAKTLRRLAQNREAARKSRLRKKAYIQNLETSRIRLSQLEQELHRSRTQEAVFGGGVLSGGNGRLSPEAAWFDVEHARWQEEHGKMMRHLRAALEAEEHAHAAAPAADAQLRQMVDAAAAHHGVLAELKAAVAWADASHLVSGAWASAAERCFLWIGGFRPSELIKVAVRHAEPLTEPQAMGVCGVQQWARDAEAALDHELQAMHRSVSETVSSDAAALLCPYSDVPGYMATMSLAIGKLASLEAFVRQADALRLQALHRLPQILTARQSARCFLAIADYSNRLRALSELWHTRPRHEPPANTPPAGSSHGQLHQSRDGLV